MKREIVIAPDKFKGSLTAWEAAESIAQGLRRGGVGEMVARLRLLPIADGGEGTMEVILRACGGERVSCVAADALGREVETAYAMVWQGEKQVAVMEMNQAAGLWRLSKGELGRREANTRGVGEMMGDAVRRGADRVLLGLGGSATNDGGVGMAQALGIRFRDGNGMEVWDLPRELRRVGEVDYSGAKSFPEVVAACDVVNPLLGPRGCTRIFGPQKGIPESEMEEREEGLRALAEAVARTRGSELSWEAGAGAAGGLGFGVLAFAGGRLEPGFTLVADLLGLEEAIRGASLVITGEGSLDGQTLEGKGPQGVAALAKRWGKPVLALCGVWDGSAELGTIFDEIRTLRKEGDSVEECMREGAGRLEREAWGACDWVIRKIAG